ncbi:hypothetical protein, partial [Bradyrhizobium japonicum]|uniref:hypothetical protein n=2 Tax=Bradyrhizobium TaxID=374 RepID=UPI001AED0ACB
QQESSPLSGRKSTQATVRICGASSKAWMRRLLCELLSRFKDRPGTEQRANRFTSDTPRLG